MTEVDLLCCLSDNWGEDVFTQLEFSPQLLLTTHNLTTMKLALSTQKCLLDGIPNVSTPNTEVIN